MLQCFRPELFILLALLLFAQSRRCEALVLVLIEVCTFSNESSPRPKVTRYIKLPPSLLPTKNVMSFNYDYKNDSVKYIQYLLFNE